MWVSWPGEKGVSCSQTHVHPLSDAPGWCHTETHSQCHVSWSFILPAHHIENFRCSQYLLQSPAPSLCQGHFIQPSWRGASTTEEDECSSGAAAYYQSHLGLWLERIDVELWHVAEWGWGCHQSTCLWAVSWEEYAQFWAWGAGRAGAYSTSLHRVLQHSLVGLSHWGSLGTIVSYCICPKTGPNGTIKWQMPMTTIWTEPSYPQVLPAEDKEAIKEHPHKRFRPLKKAGGMLSPRSPVWSGWPGRGIENHTAFTSGRRVLMAFPLSSAKWHLLPTS